MAGNRFVSGWNPQRRERVLWLHPRPGGSRVEVVNLEARSRRLLLRGEFEAAPDAELRFRIAGRDPVTIPLPSPIEIDLPDLATGRVAIDLWFPGGPGDFAFDQAGLRGALPPGEARIESGVVVQTGSSRVDIVRRVPAGARLAGSFDPPHQGSKGQRFELTIEREEDAETVFEWRQGDSQKPRQFEAQLAGNEEAFVRISLLAIGDGGQGRWRNLRLRLPQEAIPTPPPIAEPPSAPKLVLLYVLDALRADRIGHLGNSVDDSDGSPDVSPNIDALAAEGITFTNNLTVAPNTLPSTKALFTGYAYRSRGGAALPPDGAQTLAEVFAAAGYRTAALSANLYVGKAHGLVRGFDHEGGDRVHWTEDRRTRHYNDSAERVHEAAVEWLDTVSDDERAFLYLHTLNPHNPYDPPEPFRSRFAGSTESVMEASSKILASLRQGRRQAAAEDQQRIRDLYTAGVAYNDAHLGSLLEIVNSRYSPGEALIIVTSDHGDELFDHGGVLHGYTLYDEQLRIPLIFWWPGRIGPARSALPTDNLDLHETLRALLRAPASGRGGGRSLWPELARAAAGIRQSASIRPVRFAAAASLKGGIFMARSERYKLLWAPRVGRRWGQGEGLGRSRDPEFVFDLHNDPGETVNLAGDRSLEVDWLRSRLKAWMDASQPEESNESETQIDEETRAKLRALGYVD